MIYCVVHLFEQWLVNLDGWENGTGGLIFVFIHHFFPKVTKMFAYNCKKLIN